MIKAQRIWAMDTDLNNLQRLFMAIRANAQSIDKANGEWFALMGRFNALSRVHFRLTKIATQFEEQSQ